MTTTKQKREAKAAAVKELSEIGAERLKTEDRFGDTKTGWWLDGVYLGPLNDPEYALRVVRGGR